MLILPEEMRDEVRKPFGKIHTGGSLKKECESAAKPLISVGDQCTYDLVAHGILPDICIFDFKIKRVEIPPKMKQSFSACAKAPLVVLSAPGQISNELISAVRQTLEAGSGAVFVAGEDDLSSLLVMANAKSGTLIYGQPDEGAVVVPLGGKEIQNKAQDFLDRMIKV